MDKEIIIATSNKLAEAIRSVSKIDVNSPDAENEINMLKQTIREANVVLKKLKNNLPLT